MLTQHAVLQRAWCYDYELLPAICYTGSINYLHPMLYHGGYDLRHICILCGWVHDPGVFIKNGLDVGSATVCCFTVI